MALDTSGALLEGIRFSIGNNVYTYPPNDAIVDSAAFSGITERAEYAIVVGSSNSSKKQLEIADPDLLFYWTRNDSGSTRFDYDSFSNRWLPLPGAKVKSVGSLSNDTRIAIPVPNFAKTADSPFALFLDETPRISFHVVYIGSGSFSSPGILPALTVELNLDGQLNFSAVDVAMHGGKLVSFTGQNFTPRTQGAGNIGDLPDISTSDYRIFMNPLPASGQMPRIRIGYGPHLIPEQISLESLLTPPSPGYVRWSVDTGRLKFAVDDIAAHLGESVYYDGVFLGHEQFTLHFPIIVTAGWPNVSFNILEAAGAPSWFVVFAEKVGQARRYFTVVYTSPPYPGQCYLDKLGNFYLSASDVALSSGWLFGCINTRLLIGAPGVGVTMRRSSVNMSGPAVVPDFIVTYKVDQVLTNSITAAPFAMLPTVPIVDSEFELDVEGGEGSFFSFTTKLVDATDPTKFNLGYILDLDARRMKYSTRHYPVAYQLPKDQSSIKLDGAALNDRGIQVKKNGTLLSASEFDVDTSSGLIEFVEPVGEGDVNSRDVSGTVSGVAFTAQDPSFSTVDVGKRLLILSGTSSGIYDIASVSSSTKISVRPSFAGSGAVSASVRSTDETIADRFWTPVSSTPKKFSISRSFSGPSGTFTKIDVSGYAVKQNVGQVSVTLPASPGESFKVAYISLDSQDEGVTTTPTSRIEMALFKVAQESVIFTVGTKVMTFNPTKLTVDTSRPIVLYIEGVTQDPADYTFTSPGTITHKNTVTTGPITIDYWVQEAQGGETVFDLLHSPVDYDALKVSGPIPGTSGGQTSMQVSGNQTSTLKPFSALLVEDQDVLYISMSSYDASSDLTQVTFAQPVVSDGTIIKVTDTIKIGYLVSESKATEIFVYGTNSVRMHGDSQASYKAGTVIDFDGDPYWVRGSSYDSNSGITTISTSGKARRNYISPTVQRSVRPVFDPSSQFSTSRPAHISRGFTLAKMGTNSSSILQQGTDYTLGDDGVIGLKSKVVYGDVLRAMYVARVPQPAGTVFEFNFAREVAPDQSNKLLGQKLRMKYNLLAPDSFFYRVETVVSMLPEAKDAMTASSTPASSGPNIASTPSRQTKDGGLPSPWYDEVHYGNIDVVAQQFLKFYQDLINAYEDILMYVDGRQVGGSYGRFRYDGQLGRVILVDDYWQIKNDIDDAVILYYTFEMDVFPPFPPKVKKVPVYGKMSVANGLSRIFPMKKIGSAFIGPVTGVDSGTQIGSFKISNILSAGVTTTVRASAFFTSSLPISGGTQFTIDSSADATELENVLTGGTSTTGMNGDPSALSSPFLKGQKIQVFDLDGVMVGSGEVLDVDDSQPYLLPTTVSTSLKIGSIVQTAPNFLMGGDANMQNRYTPGPDYMVQIDTGQIVYLEATDPPLNNPLKGNEIIQSELILFSTDTKPFRFPALDGKELSDSGQVSIPRIRIPCELRYLIKELSNSGATGFAKHENYGQTLTDLSFSGSLNTGDEIKFTSGTNLSFVTTVTSVSGNTMTVSPAPPSLDSGSSFFISGGVTTSNEVNVLNEEISKLDSVIGMFGTVLISGSGTATSTTTWVSGADFTGTDNKLLWVQDGPARGLYKVESASAHTITVSPSPYQPLILGSGSYSIVDPWPFLQEAEYQFVAEFYRNTLTFLQNTLSPGPDRVTVVKQRQTDLKKFIDSLTTLLQSGDNLYDTRYLWINERTNKENGLIQLQGRAFLAALDAAAAIVENQRKEYLLASMMTLVS